MGVTGYWKSIGHHHPECIKSIPNTFFKGNSKQRPPVKVDHLLFDLNPLFHAFRAQGDQQRIQYALHKVKSCILALSPRKSVFLAFDGPGVNQREES